MIQGVGPLMFTVWRLPLLLLPIVGIFAQGVYRVGGGDTVPAISPELRSERDALRVDPAHYRLEFANQSIRVLRLKLGSQEEDLMHFSEDVLIVCLNGCDLDLRQPDGQTATVHLKAGETRWIHGGMRTEKNIGSQPLELLLIEKAAQSSGR